MIDMAVVLIFGGGLGTTVSFPEGDTEMSRFWLALTALGAILLAIGLISK